MADVFYVYEHYPNNINRASPIFVYIGEIICRGIYTLASWTTTRFLVDIMNCQVWH